MTVFLDGRSRLYRCEECIEAQEVGRARTHPRLADSVGKSCSVTLQKFSWSQRLSTRDLLNEVVLSLEDVSIGEKPHGYLHMVVEVVSHPRSFYELCKVGLLIWNILPDHLAQSLGVLCPREQFRADKFVVLANVRSRCKQHGGNRSGYILRGDGRAQ